jgi:hypothetical protein
VSNPIDHERAVNATQIRQKILELVNARGVGKSICPSEVARALAPEDWRAAMPAVRAEAQLLVDEQAIIATQQGEIVSPLTARGPIRLALPKD